MLPQSMKSDVGYVHKGAFKNDVTPRRVITFVTPCLQVNSQFRCGRGAGGQGCVSKTASLVQERGRGSEKPTCV